MPYFTPPTVSRASEAVRLDPLFSRIKIPRGLTVLKAANGAYFTVETPTPEQIDEAAIAYLGGHTYTVSDEEAASLTAAGYEVTE